MHINATPYSQVNHMDCTWCITFWRVGLIFPLVFLLLIAALVLIERGVIVPGW